MALHIIGCTLKSFFMTCILKAVSLALALFTAASYAAPTAAVAMTAAVAPTAATAALAVPKYAPGPILVIIYANPFLPAAIVHDQDHAHNAVIDIAVRELSRLLPLLATEQGSQMTAA
ncbi:hypothetical protein FB45DRAFT_1024512 [Roridomyces roridus]|uniref:Uncharacterized protein n=1 Tax=Roridomyces roridus TaxID=1738132 RepID=A0AAD7FT98_9AGAR|nr:hypothetical protein FB45DRAFT_1024512 [Roridomyces roridus]